MSWLLLRGAARCQFSVPSRKRMEDSKDINRWLQLEKMQLISLFGSKAREEIHADEKTEGRVGWRIFLSYARADEAAVRSLYDRLNESGFTPWMDVKDIHPGEDWSFAIQEAIRDCDFFILCLTPNSVGRRGFLQREIKTALDRLL